MVKRGEKQRIKPETLSSNQTLLSLRENSSQHHSVHVQTDTGSVTRKQHQDTYNPEGPLETLDVHLCSAVSAQLNLNLGTFEAYTLNLDIFEGRGFKPAFKYSKDSKEIGLVFLHHHHVCYCLRNWPRKKNAAPPLVTTSTKLICQRKKKRFLYKTLSDR